MFNRRFDRYTTPVPSHGDPRDVITPRLLFNSPDTSTQTCQETYSKPLSTVTRNFLLPRRLPPVLSVVRDLNEEPGEKLEPPFRHLRFQPTPSHTGQLLNPGVVCPSRTTPRTSTHSSSPLRRSLKWDLTTPSVSSVLFCRRLLLLPIFRQRFKVILEGKHFGRNLVWGLMWPFKSFHLLPLSCPSFRVLGVVEGSWGPFVMEGRFQVHPERTVGGILDRAPLKGPIFHVGPTPGQRNTSDTEGESEWERLRLIRRPTLDGHFLENVV